MASNQELIAQVYVGFYDRAPDPVGLQYWVGRLEAGVSIQDIADSFAASPEAADTYAFFKYPGLLSPKDFLAEVYQNVFGRAIDADGLKYYMDRMEAGESAGSVVASILGNAATNEGSADQAYLQNKVDAGLHWALEAAKTNADIYQDNGRLDANADASAHGALDGITADPKTVDAANAATDAYFAGGGGITSTFTLTAGDDFADVAGSSRNGGAIASDFVFTGGNEAVSATTATLNATDVLADGSNADNDQLNVSASGAGSLTLAGAAVSNIENINITASANADGNTNLSTFTGVRNVTVTGVVAAAGATLSAFAASGVETINTSAVTGGKYTISDGAAHQDISVTTGSLGDSITLGDGSNTIDSGAGNDTIIVGDGDNTINAGSGADTVTIGDGNNTINLGNGANTVNGSAAGNNTITSLEANDTIVLGGGDNTIDSGAGDDSITVGNGDNTIKAGAGDDTIIVGNGDNHINAGAGQDTITLGTGDNVVVIGAEDGGLTTATADVIIGFDAGGANVLALGTAGSSLNYAEIVPVGPAVATTVEEALAVETAAGTFDGTLQYVLVSGAADSFLLVDHDLNGEADYAVKLTGIDATEFGFANIIA